jgi:hypothetical protein
MQDAMVLFDDEEKPVWYPHAMLRTFWERGELAVTNREAGPGLLEKILGW